MSDFETLKKRLESLKLEKARCEGSLETICNSWKEKYNTDSINDIKKIYLDKAEELRKIREDIANLMLKATELLNDIERT